MSEESGQAHHDSSKVPVYRMGNIVGGRLVDENLKYVDEHIDDLPDLYLKTNDILFNRTNSYELVGKAGIYTGQDDTATFASYLIRIRLPGTFVLPQFCSVAMNAPYYRQTQIEPEVVQQCGQANFNGTKLASTVIPVPPIAEQKRIVAKVDELMAWCDQLESQQQERKTRHAVLARAALARFAEAPTPANLDFLFHKSYAIAPADLRKSILTLAVQGKLAHQDPSDQPAENALAAASTLDRSSLAELPPNWFWARVNETGRVDLGRQRAPQHHHGPYMRPYLRVQNVYEARIDISDVKEMNFTPAEFETFALREGDVLLNEGQSRELVGRPAIYRGEVPGACFQNTLVRYRPFDCVTPEYALVVFRAYMRTGRFQEVSKQTTNIAHLSAGRFAALEFPLPPLAEQRRIVAKVDELMALVDALESQLATARTTAETLLAAAVAELTRAS